MHENRWRQIESLFSQALAKNPPERETFLREICAGDEELRERIERLLAADARAEDGVFENIVGQGVRSLYQGEAASWIGRRLGCYRLVREIGRGGISSVFEAERVDGRVQMQVAVKLIRQGMDSEDIRGRFLRERQILADLDHPNIARFFDGGETEEGLPYVVMEFIEGEPIDGYCDRHGLDLAQRIDLFRKVCDGVSHAHRNLVVHLDLKPGNVLVTHEGVPKLLDFGIAKLLLPNQDTPEETSWANRLMTLAYASPEQLQGRSLSTLSDVYSLGVILYQLLVGPRPFQTRKLEIHEIRQLILEKEPEKPSTLLQRWYKTRLQDWESKRDLETVSRARGCSPEKLMRDLRGDLDAILLTALQKRTEDRYPSVDHFSADLERYRQGRPISALLSSFPYRMKKFFRRYWPAVTTSAAFVLLLLFFLVTLLAESRRTQAEKTRAEQVSAMLIGLFGMANPSAERGRTITARELVDEGAEKLKRMEGQPETRAMLLDIVGELYFRLGLYDPADEMFGKSLDLRRQHFGDKHPDVALGFYNQGTILGSKGDFEEAARAFEKALEIRLKLYGPNHPDTAACLNNLALANHDMGYFDRAEPYYRESVKVSLALLGEAHPETRRAQQNMALLFADQGRYEETERIANRILELQKNDAVPSPAMEAISLELRGLALQGRGRLEAAAAAYRRALAIRLKIYGEEHPQVARAMTGLAMVLSETGALEEAGDLFRLALNMRIKGLGWDHVETAISLQELAILLCLQGEIDPAEKMLDQAYDIYEQVYPMNHPFTGLLLAQTGWVYLHQGRLEAAEALLRYGLASAHPGDRRFAELETELAVCLIKLGRNAEAGVLLERNLPSIAKRWGVDHENSRRIERLMADLPCPVSGHNAH